MTPIQALNLFIRFQATKEGNYSVGVCYLAINNLPQHMCFLRDNISLCIVMPGPNKPNDYALDQILGLLVDKLLQLKQGDPPIYQEELVHGELSQHNADLIACIKMGGGAGVKLELNFCLYCRTGLLSLSVPTGSVRQQCLQSIDFRFGSPQEALNNVYRWKSLPTIKEQNALFNLTGNRFTALHWITGWYTSTSSLPDAMHLLYLGAMNWIVKQVLVSPGMLIKQHPGNQDPFEIFNKCLDKMWMPKNFQRLPPKMEDMYLAETKVLREQSTKPIEQNFHTGSEEILRFCLAVNTIDKRSITPAEIAFAQRLLESLCVDYVSNNVQLATNFHYLMHLEESMLKSWSVYNTHVWGKGVLEGTLMRGWWSHTTMQDLIKNLRALPNCTPANNSVIEDLLTVLRGGAEHALQHGTLMAFIVQCQTAYTGLHGFTDSTQLSSQSHVIDLEMYNLYGLVLVFCTAMWPDAGVFGSMTVFVMAHMSIQAGKATVTDILVPATLRQMLRHGFLGTFGRFGHLGVSSWACGELGELTAIQVHCFSGTFALFDISMSYGRYWVTIALDSISPERDNIDDDL
ncbi:hypothetical protein BDV93DRAFT_511869 [Ceratobasidium sp. AG-I]|nr:hypothetical protein BDV93DRAFT_511869 [Ceratobasidium sp. AG-I]